jgi:hypothetical protein
VKRAFGLGLLAISVVLLAQACGSEDDKKKSQPGPQYPGSGGEDASSGGSSSPAAGAPNPADGGDPSTTGTAGTSNGGTPSAGSAGTSNAGTTSGGTNDGGTANTGLGGDGGSTTSQAGAAGSDGGDGGDDCQAGFAECDGNPLTVCEQSLNLPATCGSCTNTCSSANGFTVCEDQQCQLESCLPNYDDCNDDVDDGCETNLVNNNFNCGQCGRNCSALGATCQTNRCSTIAMVQNFGGGTDSDGNEGWAFSSAGLLQHGPAYNYTIRRFPLSGGPIQAVWHAEDSYVGWQSLLVQGDDVLWSQRGTPNVVMKKAITADAAVPPTFLFYPEYHPMFLRQVGAAYYWITGQHQGELGYVYTRAVGADDTVPGTRIVTVNQGRNPRAFAVTTDAIYWVPEDDGNAATVDDDLRTTPLSGGTYSNVPVVSAGDTSVSITDKAYEPTLQAVGDTLYFTHTVGTSAINGIYRYKTGDAKPTQILSADNITSFMVDDTYAYYTRQNTAGVWRAPLSIGAGEQISTGGATYIVGQDAQFVYAITSSSGSSSMYKVIK